MRMPMHETFSVENNIEMSAKCSDSTPPSPEKKSEFVVLPAGCRGRVQVDLMKMAKEESVGDGNVQEYLNQQLYWAALTGDHVMLKTAVEFGADVNYKKR